MSTDKSIIDPNGKNFSFQKEKHPYYDPQVIYTDHNREFNLKIDGLINKLDRVFDP